MTLPALALRHYPRWRCQTTGPRDCAHGIEYSRIGMGSVPYLISVVMYSGSIRTVGIEENYPCSTRVGLLSSYLARICGTLSLQTI